MKTNTLVFLALLLLLSSSKLPKDSENKATVVFYFHKSFFISSKAKLMILNNDKYIVSLDKKQNYHIKEFEAEEQLFWTQIIYKHSYTRNLKANETYVVYLRVVADGIYPGVEIKTLHIDDLDQVKKRDQKKILEILDHEKLITYSN